MPKRLSKNRSKPQTVDPNVAAFRLVQHVIGQTEPTAKPKKVITLRRIKNPAAVALGRKGRNIVGRRLTYAELIGALAPASPA
jgi:hypothetical protein